MTTHDGDLHPSATPTAAPGTRLVRALLLTGTLVLLVVAVQTFPVPGTPPLSEMDEATVSAPGVIVDCRPSWDGSVASNTCYWKLRLDDGRELAWPSADPEGSSGDVREYLRAHGPVTVHFWSGQLYQIESHDGEVYLDYRDTYDSGWLTQRLGVILGLFVGAMSLIRIEWAIRGLADPDTATPVKDLDFLGLFCAGGTLVVASVGTHRMWIGVVGLALFAALAPAFGQTIMCRARGPALRP